MVQQLKQCPTCHFTFADFHCVCAFDGAELVPYEKPQSLMKAPQPPIRPRRSLKPSMSLTSLAVLAVFLSAVLIAYLKSPSPSIPAVVIQERNANSVTSTARAGRIGEGFTAERKPTARATRVKGNLKRPTARVLPEVNRPGNRSATATIAPQRKVQQTARVLAEVNRPGNRSPTATIAHQREVRQTSRAKPPKVVAILKTTWKVLKKPFNF